MRALTLTQPWAGLVASGLKLVENRPRRMIKAEDFGKPFAIHASREIDRKAWRRVIEIAPETAVDYPGPMAPSARIHRLAAIASAVISVATIDRVLTAPIDPFALPESQLRWFFGPIGYVLRDVIALPTPVPCRGFQGFWTLPLEVELQVMLQIESATRDELGKRLGVTP